MRSGTIHHMSRLVKVSQKSDIFSHYRNTPVESFLEYHNLDRPFETYSKAELVVGMCMDNRKHLHIPDNFAYVLRAGGANLRYSEFKVSYAIAIGGIQAIVLLAHTQCGMSNLISRKEQFIQGLVDNAGWSREQAEEHFDKFAPLFEIGNELDFVVSEAKRLRARYPKVLVAPMLYRLEDNLIYLINEH